MAICSDRVSMMRKMSFIFLLTLLVLPFQNCSTQTGFSTLSPSLLKSFGNGGGYEGKPDIYYRFVPNYSCDGIATAVQSVEIYNDQAVLFGKQDNQCAAQGAQLPLSSIGWSPFQSEFVSVNDSLFKRYEQPPGDIPTNLAELLCRDDFSNPTFEIISHFDREENKALTRVYTIKTVEPDFSISRILSSTDVKYVSDRIGFQVDLSKASSSQTQFSGKITSSSLDGIKPQNLTCIIGGSLDTSSWKLQALSDRETTSFFQFENGEVIFNSNLSQFQSHMFKIDQNDKVTDLTAALLGFDQSTQFRYELKDKSTLMFSSQSSKEAYFSWNYYDSKDFNLVRLTNLAPITNETYIRAQPVLTVSGHLIYDVASVDQPAFLRLRSMDIKTKIANDLYIGPSLGFKTLPNSEKVAIFITGGLIVYDLKNKTSQNISVSLPDSCLILNYSIYDLKNESEILVNTTCSNGSANSLLLISLVDGSQKIIAKNKNPVWISPNQRWVFLQGSALSTGSLIYDTETGQVQSVPIDARFGYDSSEYEFSLNQYPTKLSFVGDKFLFGFHKDLNKNLLYKIDLLTQQQTILCENSVGEKLFVGSLPNQKTYLFTYDSTLKVYRFYQVKGANDCVRINEFPSAYPYVPAMVSTDIGFGLVLNEGNSQATREAVFVPMDGRPPLKLSSSTNGSWTMKMSVSKKRILLTGPDATGVHRIYSFYF